jgi:hypothetical protein
LGVGRGLTNPHSGNNNKSSGAMKWEIPLAELLLASKEILFSV